MGRGCGFGKTILFGEHFVVYNSPGIISALDLTTRAEVLKTREGGIRIVDLRKGALDYTEKKKAYQLESIERMLKFLGIDAPGLQILLEGDLPAFSGIGASAASSVAIARALSEEFGLNSSNERINAAAHEAERAYHGEKTAGLDNIAATYGGLSLFRKGDPPYFEPLRLREPIAMVLADTGIVADTKVMIEGVAERRAKDPGKYDPIIEQAKQLIHSAKEALLDFNLSQVGRLMDENHRLLQAIEVSCPKLDYLVDLARKKGALGAKQTGGGGGGCMVALTPGLKLQEKVAQAFEAEGFAVLRPCIGGNADSNAH